MAREMKLEIFGESQTGATKGDFEPKAQDVVNSKLVKEIQTMQRRIREVASDAKTAHSRVEVLNEVLIKNHQQQNGLYRNLEGLMKNNFQDMASKLSKLTGRFTEQKLSESKVQEMVDRHNQVVQRFETRLMQMQKSLSALEMKSASQQGVIEELRKALDRAKKI